MFDFTLITNGCNIKNINKFLAARARFFRSIKAACSLVLYAAFFSMCVRELKKT